MTQDLSDLVARLRTFDSPTISDACEASGQECHIVTGLAPLTTNGGIAGAVITVRLGSVDEVESESTRHLATAAVDAATTDHIIAIDHQGRDDCAGWGGNLSRGAHHRGCAGTVIDGAARDIEEATDLGYPIFGRSATPRTARGRAVEVAHQQPIELAGAPVNPCDYLIADSTGIVIIPQHVIADVLDAAVTIATHEQQIADRIDSCIPIVEAMGREYEELLQPRLPVDD